MVTFLLVQLEQMVAFLLVFLVLLAVVLVQLGLLVGQQVR